MLSCTAKQLAEMDLSDVKFDAELALNNLRVLQSLGSQLPPDVRFLLVKETSRANSSVSQGVAAQLAKAATFLEGKAPLIRVINYGGGGAKYQQYEPQYAADSSAIVGYKITEAKPGKTDRNFHKDSVLDARADLEKRLEIIGWRDPKEPEKGPIIWAVVTGDKRNTWEKLKADEAIKLQAYDAANELEEIAATVTPLLEVQKKRKALEMEVETLFQGIAFPAINHFNHSYFLPQDEEAKLEYEAVQTMWALEGVKVHGSLGLGRSSAQMGYKGGEFGIPHGMSTETKIWEVPDKIAELANVIKVKVVQDHAPGDICIALKSGFLLPVVEPELQRVLLKAPWREVHQSQEWLRDLPDKILELTVKSGFV